MSRLRRWCRVIGLVLGIIAVAVLAVVMALSRPETGQRPVRLLPPRLSHTEAMRVNTTLVELSDDGTELFSLVAPH